jgi:hypothetical protein
MSGEVSGAVGCSLNDPDRDIRRIFPEATGYRTEYITIDERGGDSLAAVIEERLGDELDEVYEALDVPYAYYTVLVGKRPVGRVHGVNQKGTYGGMQLILATDLEGKVLNFYYQKTSSPESGRFTSEAFTGQFEGVTLTDFYRYAALPDSVRRAGRLGAISDPSEKSAEDFSATLRGLKKNLILLDEFFLDNRHRAEFLAGEDGGEASEPETTEETSDDDRDNRSD